MLISIITINYNDLEGLKRTLQSVQEQTVHAFEHIMIDGGSTDGSKELIEKHQEHFEFWVSEPDQGIYDAMNKGILNSRGDYLLFLNSGDHFIDANALEKAISHLGNHEIVYFNCKVIRDQPLIKEMPSTMTLSYLMREMPTHQAIFYAKNVFDTYGNYDTNLKICSDWKHFIQCIILYSVSYLHVNDVISVYYANGLSSLPENREVNRQERLQVLQKYFPVITNEILQFQKDQLKLDNLRKSRKVNLMVRLGLLNRF